MNDKTKRRNDEALAELDEMFERAQPIREIWDHARGDPCLSKEDIAKLHVIWLRMVVGLSDEVERWESKQGITLNEAIITCPSHICPNIRLSDRLLALSRVANANQKKPFTDPVRRAAEDGFLILTRIWIEECIALIENGIAIGYGREDVVDPIFCAARISDKTGVFTKWVRNAVSIQCKEIDKNGVFIKQGIREMIELYEGKLYSLGNKIKVDELKKKLDTLQSANKDGLAVEAPAFEKRPVPKPGTPEGKTPKPIKR